MKELKKKDLKELKKSIAECRKLTGAKFSFALVKNFDKIEKELKQLEESRKKPSEKLALYNELEGELIKKLALKNEKGDYIIQKNADGTSKYTFDDLEKVNNGVIKLQKANPEAMEELKKDNEDYNTLLDEPAGIDFYKVKIDFVPDTITVEQLASIECLIEE